MQTVNGKNILISKEAGEVQEVVRAYGRIIWLASGVAGQAASIDSILAVTLPAGSEATAENIGTNQNARFVFGIPEGNGISSIEKTGSTDNVDHYRIHYTNGGYFDYDVTNGGGGGDASVWGQITGTLSDQTDLQSALNAKADTADLGTMAEVNDAPSDGKQYARKDGDWEEVTEPVWGQITGTLSDQTDLQDALDNKADVIVNSASGSIVSIPDAKASPVVGLSVGIEPVQDLHGYSNPWPAGGGVNKFAPDSVTTGYIDASGNPQTQSSTWKEVYSDYIPVSPSTNYVVGYNAYFSDEEQWVSIAWFDENKVFLSRPAGTGSSFRTYTSPANASYARAQTRTYNHGLDGLYFGVGSSVSPSPYAPYENVCPISGHTEANVCRETAYDADADPSITISLGQTVYGGRVDVLTGTMTVAIAREQVKNLSWSYYGGAVYTSLSQKAEPDLRPFCDQYATIADASNMGNVGSWPDYSLRKKTDGSAIYIKDSRYTSASDFKNTEGNMWIYYYLATPITVTITPATLNLLYGTNTIWADTGDISVDYKADTKLYIEALKAQLQALILQN